MAFAEPPPPIRAVLAPVVPRLGASMELRMDQHAGPAYTPALVACRLEQAGATLLAMVVTGTRPADVRCYWPDIPGQIVDTTVVPTAREISAMDQALSWLQLIPDADLPRRRAVGMRMLYRPERPKGQRYVFSYRRVGAALGVSHHTAESWWIQGIYLITAALNRPLLCAALRPGDQAVLDNLARNGVRRTVTGARARKAFSRA